VKLSYKIGRERRLRLHFWRASQPSLAYPNKDRAQTNRRTEPRTIQRRQAIVCYFAADGAAMLS
jgi:hypothetical protein